MLHTCIHFRYKVSRELHQSVNKKESGPWEHRRQFCELHINNWKIKFSADSYLSWIVRGWIWYTQAYQCIAQYEGSSKSSHSYRSLATAAGHLLNSGMARHRFTVELFVPNNGCIRIVTGATEGCHVVVSVDSAARQITNTDKLTS